MTTEIQPGEQSREQNRFRTTVSKFVREPLSFLELIGLTEPNFSTTDWCFRNYATQSSYSWCPPVDHEKMERSVCSQWPTFHGKHEHRDGLMRSAQFCKTTIDARGYGIPTNEPTKTLRNVDSDDHQHHHHLPEFLPPMMQVDKFRYGLPYPDQLACKRFIPSRGDIVSAQLSSRTDDVSSTGDETFASQLLSSANRSTAI
ncbi:hypothetical protein CSKR_112528 [Clonorchis sinensis]|uniref:Uncharacterized protein n=1 Tax=Clonorchis sinensis TaxID=79923 RepID=A0A3R7C1F0_CLOSI|nr:hypothetical protein CSKR_112528 [Clonorchis sinensis]